MLRALLASCGIAAGLAFAGTANGQVTLFDNGPITGGPGADPLTESVIDTGSNLFGFSCQVAGATMLIDDFKVPTGEAWNLDRLRWYGYRTGSTITMKPGDGAYVMIWNGDPRDPNTQLIWGDYSTTTRMISATFTGVYRRAAAGNGAVDRQLQEVLCDLTGSPTLYGDGPNAGRYYIGFAATSLIGPTATAITFCPAVTPRRTTPTLDNGLQWTTAPTSTTFNLINGATGGVTNTPGFEQDFPFKLRGTTTPFTIPPPPTPDAIVPALATNGTFSTISGTIGAGQIKWVKITVPAGVSATTALDIDMETSGISDASMALYDDLGFRKATSYQEGSGDLPMLSFGSNQAVNLRAKAASTGFNYNGRNGAALTAGNYYLAVASGDEATFADAFGAAANATTGSGSYTVRARYYNAASLPTSFPTPSSTDLGTLPDNTTVSTTALAMPKEGIVWVRFTVPNAVQSGSGALDISTEGSTCDDTSIWLYDNTGSRPTLLTGAANSDLDDGSGRLSALSYGTGHRNGTGRGLRFNGRDSGTAGFIINAAEYYIAIVGGNNAVANAAGYDCNAAGTSTGTVKLNVRYIQSPDPTPEVPVAEVDIGDVINGTETLSFHILPADLIWVKFNLSEDVPGNSNDKYLDVDTEGTPPAGGGAQGDTFLAYYIDGGFRLASDDDDGSQLLSQLSHGATSPVREPAGVPASGAAPARLPYDGRDGSLTAGAYLVALTMFDNDSGVTPINAFNYDATSSHSIDNSGLKLNFRSNTGVTPPA
ncbi:MAG: hypothetical protein KIT68_10325, partial [Phycisphaeraceae bacterium]|nr:hypothetical protein [Phycisphaeraceae bacterium]